ncbi:MAG: DUF1569 domain-containing protein [Gemmatimonadales bacterium]
MDTGPAPERSRDGPDLGTEMPTIQQPADRAALVGRLRRLTPTTQPGWGRLTAPRMLCHLSDQLRVALGDLPARQRSTWFTRTVARWLIIHTGLRAPPGKVPTLPEMLTTEPGGWAGDLARVESLLERASGAASFAAHPAFGPLSQREWAVLAWKHVDHHLRQFGV